VSSYSDRVKDAFTFEAWMHMDTTDREAAKEFYDNEELLRELQGYRPTVEDWIKMTIEDRAKDLRFAEAAQRARMTG